MQIRPRVPSRRFVGSGLLAVGLVLAAGCGANPFAVSTRGPASHLQGSELAGSHPVSAARVGLSRKPFRLLLVGNSLTYTNHLPELIRALSVAAGDDPPIEVAMVAYGGFALEDHLELGDAPELIAQGGWDVVTLQQGPSTLPESRVNLIEYSRRFDALIRAVGAVPAMYGVWPEEARLSAFPAGIESYREAAEAIDGLLFPVALVWQTAWQRDDALPFYGIDRFHPSRLGTYAAAVTIYAGVRGMSPVGLPTTLSVSGTTYTVDPRDALIVQQVVEELMPPRRRHYPRWKWPEPGDDGPPPHAPRPAAAPGGLDSR